MEIVYHGTVSVKRETTLTFYFLCTESPSVQRYQDLFLVLSE